MKKVFDQTVRDLKREVNKNVLKVPRIEQKVLDATSNEPWGPHGSLLSDIAMASRNYHEYQMIMSVVWKRINDTGKNWRHVYKALTVLEYMVAHGSERVIDEIREHAYQISTLSDFQYIDSSGRDQGSNVRKKSQSIVALVNDKDRVIEVRQKAAANKDKYRSPSSTGGMYRPGSGGYGDRYDDEGRYGGRDDDRYGKEREWGEERYGKNGDSNSRDGDRYDERYGRDDNYRGRSQSIDDNQYAQRSRSSDRERDRSVEDDGQYSSRGTKAEDSVDGSRKLDRKFSEQNIGAPPSYEEAVSDSKSPAHLERDGEAPVASIPKASPPPVVSSTPSQSTAAPETSVSPANQEVQSFDEFDPRSAFAATPPVSANNPEMDLLGSLALAIVPTETESAYVPPPTHSANQPFGDPFGDSPFKAVPSETIQPPQPPQTSTSTPDLAGPAFDFGDPLSGLTYSSVPVQASSSPNPDFLPPELSTSQQNSTDDVLANILPHQIPASTNPYANFQPQAQVGPGALVTIPQPHQSVQGNYMNHAPAIPMTSHMIPNAQFNGGQFSAPNNGSFYHQQQQSSSQAAPNNGNFYHQQQQSSQAAPNNGNFYHQQQQSSQAAPNNGNFYHPQQSQGAVNNSMGIRAPQQGGYQPPPPQPQPQSTMNNDVLGSLVPQATPAPKDKFETKSTVWADTLSRGLVNLNISGPKINPMADIGVDFDALNRRDKRMEKPVSTPVVSTVTMGKAMGSGSGIGRAGAGMGIRPAPNPMMGMGMGHYGTMNNNPMQMGVGQGPPMQPPGGSNVPGYNPMVGPGGYNPMQQQPYGGYR